MMALKSPLLKVTGLSKRFDTRTILKDVSFEVFSGDIIFVLGRSGTGKSVLLKTLVGLLNPEQGEINFLDQDLTKLNGVEWKPIRQKIGLIFQYPALFDFLNVYENVAYGLRRKNTSESDIKKAVERALIQVGLSLNVAQKMPYQLSFGQQKRVAIARALILQPEILLFDEPTTGLDPVSTRIVDDLIQHLSQDLGMSCVVVSHDIESALRIAHRLIFLDQGQVIFYGTPSDIENCRHSLVKSFLAQQSSNPIKI